MYSKCFLIANNGINKKEKEIVHQKPDKDLFLY
jgi:hypothetical protein